MNKYLLLLLIFVAALSLKAQVTDSVKQIEEFYGQRKDSVKQIRDSIKPDIDSIREDLKRILFWQGTRSKMTAHEFASYCAPVFWFSPDEPELHRKKGKDVNIPRPYPFEPDSGRPVVYYQLKEILIEENAKGIPFDKDKKNPNNSILDLNRINGVEINYTHYYEFEKGLGAHRHDNEQVQFKILVDDTKKTNGEQLFRLFLLEVKAKAHALSWYDNIYVTDTTSFDIRLPFHVLVEEGKHASCTDVNGDGYYTPGYDVNVSTNDAWGIRDVISTGGLFTPDFKGWMAKVRKEEHMVLPPLPYDSPQRDYFTINGVYAPDNAVYELRPMVNISKVKDRLLKHDMEDYSHRYAPSYSKDTDIEKLSDWWDGNRLLKSISVAARFNERTGIAISFPLLIVKNVETPIIGGWMVNRIYFQDIQLRDIGYNILLTPSASRFMDPYLAAGFEINKFNEEGTGELKVKTEFVMETGIKLRANVKYSFLKFLSFLTEFWGVRLGIKNAGFMEIKKLSYVFEIGAGVW